MRWDEGAMTEAGLGLAELVQNGVDLCEGLVDLLAELCNEERGRCQSSKGEGVGKGRE